MGYAAAMGESKADMPAYLTFIACFLLASASAMAAYPERPVRLVVPYAAGGSTDTVARLVGSRLGERLGHQVVVDNRTGAGTIIGTEIVARSAPDGYTLLMATPPLVVNPSLHARVPYVVDRDFTAVTNVAGSSNLLVVHPTVAAAGTRELIALLKANPGKYTYGSSGIGGAGHLAMALFLSMAEVDAVHVPYKGGAPAVVDLVAGRLSMMMANLTTAQPHIRAGRLRPLGIGTGKRSLLFPDVPTIAESGVPNYEANNWNGVVAPARTPRAIVEKLHREIVSIIREPAVVERMANSALDPIGDTPSEFARYLKMEGDKWGRLVKKAGIKAE